MLVVRAQIASFIRRPWFPMPSLPTLIARRLPFFYGWIAVAVAFVTLGLGANARGTFGILFPSILKEFGWDRGDTAFIFSVGFVVAACFAPLLGYCVDRFGPHKVLPVGTLLVAAGFAGATYCNTIPEFFLTIGLLVITASTSLSYNSHFVFLPHWFERRRGLAMGLACTGVGTSAVILFPWMQATIDQAGWRAACWTLAGVMLAVLIPLNILLQRTRPADVGLYPDGDHPGSKPRPAAVVGPASVAPPAPIAVQSLGQALRGSAFWLVAGAFFCALFAWYGILVHQTKYLQDLGFGTQFSSYALGAVPLFGIAGQIGLGALSDRIGREWIWTLACLGFAICYGLLILLRLDPSTTLVWLMVIAQGGLGYSLVSVYGAIPADLFRGPSYGLIYGCLSFFGSLGAASGPYLLGRVYDWNGSYDVAFATAVALSLLSIAFIWLAAPRRATRAQAHHLGKRN